MTNAISVPFFIDVICKHDIKPDPQKLKALMQMPPPKTKKELQAFIEIINYLGIFSPSTTDVCKSLGQMTSNKTEWTLNATYQNLFDKAKSIRKDVCTKFYDETKPLYLKTDASGVGLGAALLQTTNGTSCPKDKVPDNSICQPTTFVSKSLSSAEKNTVTLKDMP